MELNHRFLLKSQEKLVPLVKDVYHLGKQHRQVYPLVNIDQVNEVTSYGNAWAGGTDQITEDVWIWIETGQQFWQGTAGGSVQNGLFANWNTNEPNRDDEDCLLINWGGTFWNDFNCGSTYRFVCNKGK